MLSNWSHTQRTAERHVSRGNLIAAIGEYRKLITCDAADPSSLNTLGDLYLRAGRNEDAAQTFSAAARAYQHQGFTSKAIAVLKKLLRVDPSDLDAAARLAQLYATQGQRREAVRQYLLVAEAYEQQGFIQRSLQTYQRAAEIDPTNAALLATLGDRLLGEGRSQQAHQSFVAAGDEFARHGDKQSALSAYLKARQIDPNHRRTVLAVASISASLGQADIALPSLCELLERDPGDCELLRVLGSTYLAAGRFDDARRTFLRLMDLDGSAYRDLLAVCEKLLEKGDLDRAAEYAGGLVEVMFARREEQGAVDFLRKILERDSLHAYSLRRLASIYRRLGEDFNLIPTLESLAESALLRGDRDEAIKTLRELCHLEPYEKRHRDQLESLGNVVTFVSTNESPARESKSGHESPRVAELKQAWLLYRDGQTEQAIVELRRIVLNDPDNLRARLALKDLYSSANMTEMAANEWLQIGRIRYETRGPVKAYDLVKSSEVDSVEPWQQPALSPIESFGDFELVGQEDRRRSGRKSVRLPLVVISREGGWREFTETVDLCEQGMRLKLAHPVTPNTRLTISLENAKGPTPLAPFAIDGTEAEVRYCRPAPGGLSLVGLEIRAASV